jgi:predicted TIM-barrel fold metal-dependent hydrolase
VKVSGYSKFSGAQYPFEDCWPFVRAIVDAFTFDRCVWASDWPFLRSRQRQDYGPLLNLAARLFPGEAERRKLFWDTPLRLFAFGRS